MNKNYRLIQRSKRYILIAVCGCICFPATAQISKNDSLTTFTPSGELGVKVYANFHRSWTKTKDTKETIHRKPDAAFAITRAYFGYKYRIKENLTGFVKLDVGKGTASQYTAYLKNAGLAWDITKYIRLNFGLINTLQFHLQEQIWGKRYLYKSLQDEYDFSSSADAGLTINYKLTKSLRLDGGIFNGEGYKHAQDINGQFQYAAGITFIPSKGLYIRGYYDVYSLATPLNDSMANKNSIAAFIGYKTDRLSMGIEYDLQSNCRNQRDHNRNGMSVYGEYRITNKVGVFGRYDRLASNKAFSTDKYSWNLENNQSVLIGGVEYQATDKTFIAINYRYIHPNKADSYPVHAVYMNVQVAF